MAPARGIAYSPGHCLFDAGAPAAAIALVGIISISGGCLCVGVGFLAPDVNQKHALLAPMHKLR